jgi:hypothetical protein
MVKVIKNTFNFNNFKKINENARNIVYYNNGDKCYYKVYKKPLKPYFNKFLINLLRKETFVNMFCPALSAIIVRKDGKMIGYVCHKGEIFTKEQFIKYFSNSEIQQNWLRGMIRFGFFYNDFKPNNIITFGNNVSMIDLEAFRPLFNITDPKKKINLRSDKINLKIQIYNLGWYYKFLRNYKRKGIRA